MDSREDRDAWLERAMEQYEESLLRMCFACLNDAALAEDAVGKIRREVETGGERSLRLREEPCGEEQAEIIGGQQSMRCDGILKSGKDRFWHAGGERGQFQILMRIGKKM